MEGNSDMPMGTTNQDHPAQRATPGITPGATATEIQGGTRAPVAAGSLSVTPIQGNRMEGGGASMGPPQALDTPGAPPYLFSDLEPVHFVRLYPEAFTDAAKNAGAEAAMAAGEAAYELGTHLRAAQQDSGDADAEGINRAPGHEDRKPAAKPAETKAETKTERQGGSR
jgi:hypothetical protein